MERKRSVYPPPPTPPVEYEVATLPLQGQVAIVRRAVSKTWTKGEVHWERLVSSMAGYVGRARTKTRDALKYVGIQDTARALQSGAVGGAAAVGYIAARKKSSLNRILYPTIAAGLVWSFFYLRAEYRAHTSARPWEPNQHSWLRDYLTGSWEGDKPAASKKR